MSDEDRALAGGLDLLNACLEFRGKVIVTRDGDWRYTVEVRRDGKRSAKAEGLSLCNCLCMAGLAHRDKVRA